MKSSLESLHDIEALQLMSPITDSTVAVTILPDLFRRVVDEVGIVADGVLDRDSTAQQVAALRAYGGDVNLQCHLGDLHFNGRGGVVKKYTEAYKVTPLFLITNHMHVNAIVWWCFARRFCTCCQWYHMAAMQGSALGQYWVGYCCRFGYGVAQSHAEMLRYYRLSAEQVILTMSLRRPF